MPVGGACGAVAIPTKPAVATAEQDSEDAYGGDDGGGGAWTRDGSVGAGADSDDRSLLPALDRDNLLGCVTHLCPRGPIATGLGLDWSEERDVARAGLERVEGADILVRQAGPNGPRANKVSLGANGTLIPITGVIGDNLNGIFPNRMRTWGF